MLCNSYYCSFYQTERVKFDSVTNSLLLRGLANAVFEPATKTGIIRFRSIQLSYVRHLPDEGVGPAGILMLWLFLTHTLLLNTEYFSLGNSRIEGHRLRAGQGEVGRIPCLVESFWRHGSLTNSTSILNFASSCSI